MAAAKELSVQVLSQKGVVYQGLCRALLVPTAKDVLAVLPEHTPLLLILGSGVISVITSSGKSEVGRIEHGVLSVHDNQACVLMNA